MLDKARSFAIQEPVRLSASVLVFGAAVIALLAFQFNWDGDLTSIVGAVWATFVAMVESFIVRSRVSPAINE